LLLDGFECKVAAASPNSTEELTAKACSSLRLRSYVVSREMLYVNVAVLGLVYAADGTPVTTIPPSTSLVFELHQGPGSPDDDDTTVVDWSGTGVLLYKDEWIVKVKLQVGNVLITIR
jgi:hypothetical protein